jgi:cytidylate kinase
MNRNERFVITINRQFGTGGHAIGVELAERLGVRFVDRQILQAVAEKFNITESEAEAIEAKRPMWWSDFTRFYQKFMMMNEYESDYRDITSRQLFCAQESAMKSIAEKESCVVIGRCGFHVFKSFPNKLKIFLHSPLENRINRIKELYHVDEDKARLLIEDNDYTREVYTKTFTGRDRYDARNYDLSLDVSHFGVNGAANFLMRFLDD